MGGGGAAATSCAWSAWSAQVRHVRQCPVSGRPLLEVQLSDDTEEADAMPPDARMAPAQHQQRGGGNGKRRRRAGVQRGVDAQLGSLVTVDPDTSPFCQRALASRTLATQSPAASPAGGPAQRERRRGKAGQAGEGGGSALALNRKQRLTRYETRSANQPEHTRIIS